MKDDPDFSRRVAIENRLLRAGAGKEPLPRNDECTALALKLGVPDEYRNPVRIEHDGFEGDVVGHYVTREGKCGVVVQQHGTRVVHVYGEKWLRAL